MGLDHRFHTIGDQFAAGQGEFHPAMAHRDAIVHANRVEHEWYPARLADALLDELADTVQVDVPRNDVRVAVADGNERLAEIVIADASGAEKTAVRSAGIAQLNHVGSHYSSLSLGLLDSMKQVTAGSIPPRSA